MHFVHCKFLLILADQKAGARVWPNSSLFASTLITVICLSKWPLSRLLQALYENNNPAQISASHKKLFALFLDSHSAKSMPGPVSGSLCMLFANACC